VPMRSQSAANAPVATFGMPVFNGANFIERAIDSILGQDLDDFELVIADNGSTDATEEICRGYVDADERVTYHRSPENRGAAWNYTRLVPLAKGRYFKWTSHDDMIEPSYLRLISTELDDHPEASLAFPFACFIDDHDKRLKVYEEDVAWDIRGSSPAARLHQVLSTLGLCNPIFGMMRTDTLRQTRIIGAFDSSDILLLSELSLHGEFHLVREPLFLRRMHDNMSRRALKTPEDVAKWFDTSASAYNFPWTKLWIEHVEAIQRVPLSSKERRRAFATLNRDWYWKQTVFEYLQTAAERVRGRSNRYENWSEPVELVDGEQPTDGAHDAAPERTAHEAAH
jgi:glycosyltransferase involved in cell wall biosynthesis